MEAEKVNNFSKWWNTNSNEKSLIPKVLLLWLRMNDGSSGVTKKGAVIKIFGGENLHAFDKILIFTIYISVFLYRLSKL